MISLLVLSGGFTSASLSWGTFSGIQPVHLYVKFLLTMMTLTCSRRPDELEPKSGRGSVRCGLWLTTDPHRVRGNPVGPDSSSVFWVQFLLFRLGWSRVGITVRLFCGVALVVLSFMMYYYLVWAPLCVHPVVLLRPCVQGSVEGSCFEEERLDRHCTRGPIRLFSLYYYLFPRYGPYRIVID